MTTTTGFVSSLAPHFEAYLVLMRSNGVLHEVGFAVESPFAASTSIGSVFALLGALV